MTRHRRWQIGLSVGIVLSYTLEMILPNNVHVPSMAGMLVSLLWIWEA